MSSFTAFSGPLDVRYDAEASKALGADHWRVTGGFRFYVGEEGSSEWVNVPAGYLTDGASVPRALWGLIPPWGEYGQAAVVHDILCEYLSTTKDGLPNRITRARCDEILLEAMTVLGVSRAKRCMIYRAVEVYRRLVGAYAPTSTAQKRGLEAEWVG